VSALRKNEGSHAYATGWLAAIIIAIVALAVLSSVGVRVGGDRLALVILALVIIAGLIARRLLAARHTLERRLASETRGAARQAQRLDALFRIASSSKAADDPSFLAALLAEGARGLREDVCFHGLIAHSEGGTVVVDASNGAAIGPDVPALGDRIPCDECWIAEIICAGHTRVWSDGEGTPRDHAWRAFIGSPFRVDRETYAIAFVSITPLDEPLDLHDRAYVETLASICANRLRHRAQTERLHYEIEHDVLTGALNRASFRARGFAALNGERRVAVAIADVDRFREINDTLGHERGDLLLAEIAAAFSHVEPGRATVARLGADSFGLLLPDVRSRAEVEGLVDAYAAALERPLSAGEGVERIRLSASFGVAVSPEDGTNFEQLLARADAAVFAAKEAGTAQRVFFERGLEDALHNARRLERELRAALAEGQFVLYFQPHIELDSGQVAGAEALIRWNHPERGIVAPAEFIPYAEQHGLVGQIGAWVMRETIRVSAPWRRAHPGLRVWFNLSASELADDATMQRLRDLDDDVTGVGIEITETAAMRDVETTTRALDAFREANFCLALDDFGTGYSSLSQLRRLKLDIVKVDRSFVNGLPADDHDVAIIEAVIAIAKSYGFEIVAEGVENLAQVAFLAGLGCRYAQGYAYAQPMPAESFGRWLAERDGVRVSA
jgi:diguanylate cyclase (GGDEF)-like protein